VSNCAFLRLFKSFEANASQKAAGAHLCLLKTGQHTTETNRRTWSYLTCKAGRLAPIRQPIVGSSFQHEAAGTPFAWASFAATGETVF
jgi:hypothetical protein